MACHGSYDVGHRQLLASGIAFSSPALDVRLLQVGYYRSLANFLTFTVIMFTVSLAMNSHYTVVGLLAPSDTIAYPVSSVLTLAIVVTAGFTITRSEWVGGGGELAACCSRVAWLPAAPWQHQCVRHAECQECR
jgi:hypothetical protein